MFNGSRLLGDRPLNRVLDQLASVFQRHLLFDVGLIRLHRLDTQVQLLGNLTRPMPFADQPEHLQFPVGEVFQGRMCRDPRSASELAQDLTRQPIADVNLAVQDSPDGDQPLFGRFL